MLSSRFKCKTYFIHKNVLKPINDRNICFQNVHFFMGLKFFRRNRITAQWRVMELLSHNFAILMNYLSINYFFQSSIIFQLSFNRSRTEAPRMAEGLSIQRSRPSGSSSAWLVPSSLTSLASLFHFSALTPHVPKKIRF